MGTSPQKNLAIYFKSLELENVRCFGEEQTLDLSDGNGGLPQWTLILGNNGVGKTTLLQCLAWMRPVPAWKKPDRIAPEEGKPPDDLGPAINDEENEVFNSLLRLASEESLKLAVILTIDQDLGGVTEEGDEIKIGLSVVPDKDGKIDKIEPDESSYSKLKKRWKEPTDLEPTVFAYNATRYMGSSNLEEREFSDPLASLFTGGPTELYDAEDILITLHHNALQEKSDNDSKKESDPSKEPPSLSHEERLRQVKQLLATILPEDIESEDSIDIRPKVFGKSDAPGGVRFKTPDGLVPFSGLSLGYQTTMAWVTDLALRLYKLYPKSPNPLKEPAIVLIDEIDLHLHPRWQRKIMGNLTKHFTKTQFIATTHSPLMAQATPDTNLVVLRREDDDDHVVIDSSPRFVEGWRLDQILTSELFGLESARSPHFEDLIKRRNKLLDNLNRTSTEEDHLKKIEEDLDKLYIESD